MYIRKNILFLITLLGVTSVSAQENKEETKQEETLLEEVVISGQYSPQEVNKSIYEVRVINREMIDRLAGNNLADVLNQTLNLSIRPNASTGKSGVEMFGLDAQYFKILVDNVPLVNDESFGNNTDLTQINLDDILQIEIVEGAMGVEYGANASAGIINIITKKSIKGSWEITPVLQEETIGDEYNLNNKGRHIQSIKVAHQLFDKLYMDATYSRNDFKGHWSDRKGERHLLNDSLRGYEWLPKLQQSAKMTLSYRGDNHKIFFKSEYFNEATNLYNQLINMNEQSETNTSQPFSNDERYKTERFFNHLNLSGYLNDLFRYDVSVSYQEQTRSVEKYKYFIRKDEKKDIQENVYESRKVIYSKGNFSKFITNDFIDFQLGYEINELKGFTSYMAGQFFGDNIETRMGSYDVYGSAELTFSPKFSLRPGVRLLSSNVFSSEVAYSLSAKYILPNDYELRGVFGMSPRLPNYDELYTYVVDVNHNVQGNRNLTTEKGISGFLHLKKKIQFNENTVLTNRLSLSVLDVKDKIDLVIVNTSPLEYKYSNVDTFRNRNISYMGNLNSERFDVGFGITYGGTSMMLNKEKETDEFLYSFNFNVNFSYKLPKTNTIASIFFKHDGAVYEYVQRGGPELSSMYYVKGKRDAISWADATLKQGFFDNKIDVTLGVRNLFDVKFVRSSSQTGGEHTSAANSLLMGYGRSYFVKVLYKLSI